MKKNALIITFVLVGLFLLMPMLSTASAAPTSYKANATGVGAFVSDHTMGYPTRTTLSLASQTTPKPLLKDNLALFAHTTDKSTRSFSAQKSAVLALNLFKEDLRQSSPGQR